MLVQVRSDHLFLIQQHHHALLSGTLASAWCGIPPEIAPLPFAVIFAIALHDLAWLDVDQTPLFDPQSGQPYPFTTYPLATKLAHYQKGIDHITRIDPYAGLLASLHYTTFKGTEGLEPFQGQECRRQERLKQQLALTSEDEPRIKTDLHYLKLFDNFSLFICLTPPSASEASQPSWLQPAIFAKTPQGKRFNIVWQDDYHIMVDPFPFREVVQVTIPYHDLPATTFASAQALQTAWEQAAQSFWSVTLQPVDRAKTTPPSC